MWQTLNHLQVICPTFPIADHRPSDESKQSGPLRATKLQSSVNLCPGLSRVSGFHFVYTYIIRAPEMSRQSVTTATDPIFQEPVWMAVPGTHHHAPSPRCTFLSTNVLMF